MRAFALLSALGGLALILLFVLLQVTTEKELDPVTHLVQQLGDDRFENRETASKALVALGEKALPALIQAAATSEDLEVRRRAQRLVRLLLPEGYKSKSLGLDMVRIHAGAFQMGSPRTEQNRRVDEEEHHVRLIRPFFLGSREVTQEQFLKVMRFNPSWFSPEGSGKDKVAGQPTGRHPVERVTWFDALEFCNRLSVADGFPPHYRLSSIKREGNAIVSARVQVVGGRGYRLPTEAEWEYACRAGSTTPFHFGVTVNRGDANVKPLVVASGYGSAPRWPDLARTTVVANYSANRWGLHDMHGNVAEWCWDWYDKDYYDRSPVDDPKGPAKGTHRVLRGGSWLVTEGSCRSASRFWHLPQDRHYYAGFRVARNP